MHTHLLCSSCSSPAASDSPACGVVAVDAGFEDPSSTSALLDATWPDGTAAMLNFEEDWRAAKYAGAYSYAIQAGWRVLHYLDLAPQRVWQQNGLLR